MNVTEQWRVLVPVKSLGKAKSRLEMHPDDRIALATAMFTDVVAALSSTPVVEHVIVCTADPAATALARELGCRVRATAGISLNADLRQALSRGPTSPTAVVVADLPCLTSRSMTDVLAASPTDGFGFVASADQGTTMLVARAPHDLHPRFGHQSSQRHGEQGVDLSDAAGVAARIDVDTLESLDRARRHGLGPATSACLSSLRTNVLVHAPQPAAKESP